MMDKSHQTKEWIKMLPSDSNEIVGPSAVEDDSVALSKRRKCDPVKTQIGIYGWRKRCLFVLIFVLIFIVAFNLCLTLWFMEVLQFTSDGIGSMKILKGGVLLNGTAYFMNTLTATSLSSRRDRPLSFISSTNLSVSVRNSNGEEESNFILDGKNAKISAPSFNITGRRGETLFSANKKEVVFGTGEVRFTGIAGATFNGSIQTPLIRGHYKRDLSIESGTRTIDIFGPGGVNVESRAGDISLSCLTRLKFESTAGNIKFEGSKIYMPRLRTASYVKDMTRGPNKAGNVSAVYQVCICTSGQLFLSQADSECIASTEVCS